MRVGETMLKAIQAIISLLLVGFLSVGCTSLNVGRPIHVSAIKNIRPGFTTKEEILESFDWPLHNVAGPEGEIWIYRYLNGKGAARELVVSFNGPYVSTYKYY